jgi:acyl carrier protein
MDYSEIVKRVNQTLHEGFEIPLEDLKPEATLFDQLELDSLDAIDLLVHLEEKMQLKVEGEVFKDVRTMQDVYTMVEKVYRSSEGSKLEN